MDPSTLDISGTSYVTSPVTWVQNKFQAYKGAQDRRKSDDQEPTEGTPSSTSLSDRFESFHFGDPPSSRYSEVQSTTPDTYSTTRTSRSRFTIPRVSTVDEESYMRDSFSTGRTTHTAVKSVIKPLSRLHDYMRDDELAIDDDINSLDDAQDELLITPYPGPNDFPSWCETQFRSIPRGTAK